MVDEYEIRALSPHIAAAASRAADANSGVSHPCLDESAFHVLYEQTSQPLLRYLVCVTRRPDLAEDLLQETYCRLLTVPLPAMNQRQMRGYLFRIATNLMRDRWRKPRRETEPLAELPSATPPFERRLGLKQAFDRLKLRERQLLWLAYVEGSDHREIAACTGLQAASIRLLLSRARHRLAELLAGKSIAAHREGRK